MSCSKQCEPCTARENYVCHGDFLTSGEYASIIDYFNIHGVSFNQKIDSVNLLLDVNTIQILKVFICDSNNWDYTTKMEIIYLLDEIIRLIPKSDNSFQKNMGGDVE